MKTKAPDAFFMTSTDEKKQIAEEAHTWQALIADGPLSEQEKTRLDAWLDASSEHRDAFERAKSLWADMSTMEIVEIDPAHARPLVIEKVLAQRKHLSQMTASFGETATRFSAAAAILLIAAYVVLLNVQPAPPSAAVVHRTGLAETKELRLEDGSTVALGAVSVLSVQIDAKSRDIELREGDAFFDVSHDPERPFTVLSGGVQARAVGTSFQVSRRPDEVSISVAEGIVDVDATLLRRPQGMTASNGLKSVRLTIGQQVSAGERDGLGAVSDVDVDTLGAWREGRLIYVNAPLSNLVSDANRYGVRRIYIADEQVADLVINAVFRSDDIDGMLATLSEALPISLRDYPDGVYIHTRAADLEK